MFRKIALGLMGLLLAGVAFVYFAYGDIGRVGSGYAAKNMCSGVFISGFSPEDVQSQALVGASPLLEYASFTIDEQDQRVSARVFGLFERTAVVTPGIGCTLLPPGETETDLQVTVLPPLSLPTDVAWPLGTATPSKTDRFDDLLEEAFSDADPQGPRNTKAIVVAHKGELIAEKYAEGVEPDTPLLSWSMAKSVTALQTGILVGEGLLDPAAPAPVPQWQVEANDPRAEITLDQLLRMSSGLRFGEVYSPGSDVTQMLSNEASTSDFAASMPLDGPPDTIWSYSSGTTNIIAGINRRVVGDSLQAAYMHSQQRLFRPLGIGTAIFEADSGGTFIGSSYMYASARDWARLGQFCLQEGVWAGERILPEGWMEYLVTPTRTSDANNYGAHFWLNRNPSNPVDSRIFPQLPEDAYYMGGFQGQIVLVIPSKDLVIARFGFTPAENTGVEKLAAALIALLDKEDALAMPPE